MFANHVRNWSINLRIFLRKSVKYDWGDHLPLDLFLLFHWWSYLPSSYHYHYHEQYVYVLSLEKFYYSTRKGIVQILIIASGRHWKSNLYYYQRSTISAWTKNLSYDSKDWHLCQLKKLSSVSSVSTNKTLNLYDVNIRDFVFILVKILLPIVWVQTEINE
jgi:hypothetical protein